MSAGTIFVLVILIAVVALVVRKMIKDKRAGKTCASCGGNCGCCSAETKAAVHKEKNV